MTSDEGRALSERVSSTAACGYAMLAEPERVTAQAAAVTMTAALLVLMMAVVAVAARVAVDRAAEVWVVGVVVIASLKTNSSVRSSNSSRGIKNE